MFDWIFRPNRAARRFQTPPSESDGCDKILTFLFIVSLIVGYFLWGTK